MRYIAFLLAATATFLLCACSEDTDNPKYRSVPPQFSDITFQTLSTGSNVLQAGEPFVATAVQSTKGKLLNATTYTWEVEDQEFPQKFASSTIYDKNPMNPTDTITPTAKGRYKLVLNARYNISGQAGSYNGTNEFEDGHVSYSTPTWQYYRVEVVKYFTVN